MDTLYNKQEEFFSYIKKSILENNKLTHAYLVETNAYPDYLLVIKEMVKMILTKDKENKTEIDKIKYQIDTDCYSDLVVINPDGTFIKKEQLLEIEMKFSKKSMLDNKMIYIINGADKLNQSSANTILKFLEEPPHNVIAILITESKYNVLDTIVSRCQLLSLKNNESLEVDENITRFVEQFNNPKRLLIDYDYYLENLFSSNSMAIKSLKLMEEYLSIQLKGAVNQNFMSNLIDRIAIINNHIEKLQYNVNLKLFYTNFVFALMEEVNDGGSNKGRI